MMLSALLSARPVPYEVSAHMMGEDTLYVAWFALPKELRGKGLGRKAWEHYERQLPKHIKRIRLHAADSGSGSSAPFWEAMGFDWRYQDDGEEELSIEAQQEMEKERTLY